jgi:hypothetical protein
VNSIIAYLAGVQSFLESNDIVVLNWKKIAKYYPEQVTNNLRAYTKEEIAKFLSMADLRDRCLILLMAYTGMRVGAIKSLKIKHLTSCSRKTRYTFCYCFLDYSKKCQSSEVVRDFMIISAYGLVLLFTSNQANILVFGPYPPFGLATISFMGLSSYLVLVGIYYSAISVAEDSKLRQSIGHFALEEAKLLDSMAQLKWKNKLKILL